MPRPSFLALIYTPDLDMMHRSTPQTSSRYPESPALER